MTFNRRSFVSLAAAGAWPAAHAQTAATFPSRPITWVVPYPSDGFGDALSGLLAQKMGDDLKAKADKAGLSARWGGAIREAGITVE